MIYIKKYSGNNYFLDAVYLDSLVLNSIVNAGSFSWQTEKSPFGYGGNGKIGQRQGGDFGFKLSFLQPERSTSGKTPKQFFLDNDELEQYFYLVIITNGTEYYSGIATPQDVNAIYFKEKDNTQSNDPFDLTIDLWCFDILGHWAERCGLASLATLDSLMPNGQIYTFEQYVQQVHFNGLTGGKVLIGLPATTYKQHLQPYGNPAGVWCYSDLYNFISNRASISRWEAFSELRLGLGFEFEMYLNVGTEFANEPEFIFNIFFLADLENETPQEFNTGLSLEMEGYSKSSKYVYMRYRQFEKSGVDYSNGILFGKNDFYSSDADNGHDELYPCLLGTLQGKVLDYDTGTGTIKTAYKDIDFIELELKMYEYSHSSGGAIGKLGDSNTTTNDGFTARMAYAYIFKSATGAGTAIDLYNNKPIQEFAIQNYKRYLKAYSETYEMGFSYLEGGYFPEVFENVNLNLDNGKVRKCFISEINDRNFFTQKSKLVLRQY